MTAGPNDPHLGLVVEGRGDLGALPILLRTALQRRGDYRDLLGGPVACHGHDKALTVGGIEGYVGTAARRPGCRAVLTYRPTADAEGLIRSALGAVKYVKPVWQPRLAARVDLELAASRSPSLRRLLAKLDSLRPLVGDTGA